MEEKLSVGDLRWWRSDILPDFAGTALVILSVEGPDGNPMSTYEVLTVNGVVPWSGQALRRLSSSLVRASGEV